MRIYVPLTLSELERLTQVARRERRRVQDQAAHLISVGLDVEASRSETLTRESAEATP